MASPPSGLREALPAGSGEGRGNPLHLLAIVGPTATGKTALAVDVAHALGTEILSADSRQVYRGLDLGTGKDLEEYRRHSPAVPYHLIDIADPREVYSLFHYQRDCYAVMDSLAQNLAASPVPLVLAGGTGLYMEAVLRKYRIANVPENAALRAALSTRDHGDLAGELAHRDPELAGRTDLTSKKRVVRALEIVAAARNHSSPLEYSRIPTWDFTFTLFCTTWERKDLRDRIDARLNLRLQAGLVTEVEGLLAAGVSPERLKLLGMEYREITAYLLGEKAYPAMIESLRHEIHLLAKRQETYFRGMRNRGLNVHWLPQGSGASSVLEIWQREKTAHA